MRFIELVVFFTIFFDIITSAPVKRKRFCPNSRYCDCDFESKRIECLCQLEDCKHDRSLFNFANKTLTMFKDIYINNINHIDQSFFEYSTFMPDFRLSLQSINYLDSYVMSHVNNLKYLEIIYDDLIEIKPYAFDRLKCDVLSLISFGKNFQLNLNSFGSETNLNNLVLDYHSSSFMHQLFYINETYSIKNQQDLVKYWSSNASIKRVFIQEAKGIKILDETCIPKFRHLNTIEIIFTDIEAISENFIILHSSTLMHLTIRQSKIEVLKANLFERFQVLEYLDLGSNPIKMFDIKSFNGLNLLHTLKLQSISDSYILDNEDICMLTYLPCGLDVYLDNYDETILSCAIIYLHEIKNDTEKFKSTIGSSYFYQLNEQKIKKMRDEDCKLKDRVKNCLKITNRNKHCLYPNEIFNFNDDDNANEIGINIIADVNLDLNKNLFLSDFNMTFEKNANQSSESENLSRKKHINVNWNYLGNSKISKNKTGIMSLEPQPKTNIELDNHNFRPDKSSIFMETTTPNNIPISTTTKMVTLTEKTTVLTTYTTKSSTITVSTSTSTTTTSKLIKITNSSTTSSARSTIRQIATSTIGLVIRSTSENLKLKVSSTQKTTQQAYTSFLTENNLVKNISTLSFKSSKSSLKLELINLINQNFKSNNSNSSIYLSHNFSFYKKINEKISNTTALKNSTIATKSSSTSTTSKVNKIYNFPLKYFIYLNKSISNNDTQSKFNINGNKKQFAMIVTKSTDSGALEYDTSTISFVDLSNISNKTIKYSDFLIIIILSLIVVGLLQFSVGCFAFYIFYMNMKNKIGLLTGTASKNSKSPVEPKNFTQKYEFSSQIGEEVVKNSSLNDSVNQSTISNSNNNYQLRKVSGQKIFSSASNKLNESRLGRQPSHNSYDPQSRLFARPSIERI